PAREWHFFSGAQTDVGSPEIGMISRLLVNRRGRRIVEAVHSAGRIQRSGGTFQPRRPRRLNAGCIGIVIVRAHGSRPYARSLADDPGFLLVDAGHVIIVSTLALTVDLGHALRNC